MANKKDNTGKFQAWLKTQDLSKSANSLRKNFRKETGYSISNEKGNAAIRQAKGKEVDVRKAVHKSKKPPKPPKAPRRKLPKYQEPTTFSPMAREGMYFDKTYAWIVGYRYKGKDGRTPKDERGFSDYVTIISDRPLSKREIKEQAAAYIDEGMSSNADDRYDSISKWYPSTLTIVDKYFSPWKV